MYVLVACEESQEVCKAFRQKGHEAYSCDLQQCSGGHPEWHICGDVLEVINGRCNFTTVDGTARSISGRWDLIIAHPPCTYLSNVATRHFSLRCSKADNVVKRWEERAKAAVFFMQIALCDCEKVCVENPVGFMNTAYCKPTQVIHPYQFASSVNDSDYVTKRTCLWLKGLKPLVQNCLPCPDNAVKYGRFPSGKARTWEDSAVHGSVNRSKTFPGIAKAMADQWG